MGRKYLGITKSYKPWTACALHVLSGAGEGNIVGEEVGTEDGGMKRELKAKAQGSGLCNNKSYFALDARF
jgi:hypothetical protein